MVLEIERGGRHPSHRDPPEGWPLDRVFVGVGTLRTMREVFYRQRGPESDLLRAWDVATRSSVSVQGAADSLERLERSGLVEVHPPARDGGADRYRLDATHPLHTHLAGLFDAERQMVPRHLPCGSRRRR